MVSAAKDGRELVSIGSKNLEILMAGSGPTILFLHGGLWLGEEDSFAQELSRHARVIAPNHPGFGASDDPGRLASADDLAYFYLDMINELGLENIILAGASFGGFVAAEMAIKNCSALAGLVLIDALGIRPGSPTDRVIADIFGIRDSELVKLAFHNTALGNGDLRSINDDDELRRRLRARQSLAHYAWQPFMHNPRLQERLHRVEVPSLVLWGEHDGIVSPDYGRTYASELPQSEFELVKNAAHFPHVEQPVEVATRIAKFAATVAGRAKSSTRGSASAQV